MFVDTHAHLQDRRFDEDRDLALERALGTGMPFLVDVGFDRETVSGAVALAATHPRVYATVGVHPHQAGRYGIDGALDLIREFVDRPRVVALGEMGLDYYYDHSTPEVQREVFRAQLEEARRRDLPVVVHVRDADEDAIRLMSEGGWPRGIWHCFSSGPAAAEAALAGGLMLSFSGVLTYPRSKELQEVARTVPRDRLLVETDCPYLAPAPCRGARNEPAFVEHTGRFLAALRGEDPAELAAAVNRNAARVFGIDPGAGRES